MQNSNFLRAPSDQSHHKCSWYSNSGGGGCQEYVPRGTRVAPCCRWDTRQRGAAPWRGRDEQPSWTREQPVLLAEVVAPPLLSRGAAISGSGGAQIDRLAVKMSNRCSSGLSCCCSCSFGGCRSGCCCCCSGCSCSCCCGGCRRCFCFSCASLDIPVIQLCNHIHHT